jgi:hypothetical protein
MQIANIPLKYNLPFATNDSAKVEIPITTSDPSRFSLSLGSPPLTGQPPESGGVPPQLEDFNGAVNQVSRVGWWAEANGPWPFDATFASDPNVNGYPQGSVTPAADLLGVWICTADNNTVNPDTVGTNWAPGWAYGRLSLTGQTGGTVTLTPAQAMKRTMSVAGTLASNLTIIVPAWILDWSVTNTTTGAFTVTVKTAAGSGVVIPQNSTPTPVKGDGTNVTQLPQNIAAGTSPTHPMRTDQAIGRLIGVQVFQVAGSFTYTPTTGTNRQRIRAVSGGGGGGGAATTGATTVAAASGGTSGAYVEVITATNIGTQPVVIGSGGTAGASTGGAGGTGGATQLGTAGALINLPGGNGGNPSGAGSPPFTIQPPNATTGSTVTISGATIVLNLSGVQGSPSLGLFAGANGVNGGGGGSNPLGLGQSFARGAGTVGTGFGAGGAGGGISVSTAGVAGAAGTQGCIIIEEYA